MCSGPAERVPAAPRSLLLGHKSAPLVSGSNCELDNDLIFGVSNRVLFSLETEFTELTYQ